MGSARFLTLPNLRMHCWIHWSRKQAPICRLPQVFPRLILQSAAGQAIKSAVRQAANGHPAKRIFQAIRIEVNDELGILEKAFRTAVHHLKPGGRIAIITFHSLEDRIAKQTLKEMARGCICPPELPVCVCHHKPEIRLLGKPKQATADELAHNSRSKSAKLRIAEKLATDNNQEETRKGER